MCWSQKGNRFASCVDPRCYCYGALLRHPSCTLPTQPSPSPITAQPRSSSVWAAVYVHGVVLDPVVQLES